MLHVGEKLFIALIHFSHTQAFVFPEKTETIKIISETRPWD